MPEQGQQVEERERSEGRAARSATAVALAIVLSKLAGLLRQRVVAHYFGTSIVADVIAAAFRVGNLAQNLLGEGTLSASFIPAYARLRAEGRHAEAEDMARAALGLLSVSVIVVSAVGVAAAPWLSLAIAAGFDVDKLAMTTRLVRIVFPMTGVLVLCAWALGVLNAHRRFFLPYFAPVVWSAAQIAALLIAGAWLGLGGEALARALAVGALVGAALELAWLLERTRPLLRTLRPSFDHRNAELRVAVGRLPAVIVGRGVIQLSGLVDTLLVSYVGSGANATFAYAQTLYLLPMSVLGTGEAAVSLPEMATDAAESNLEQQSSLLRSRLGAALGRVVVWSVPAMVALGLCGSELITVLLETGRFDRSSTVLVAEPLVVYSVALVANASVRLFATTFFALGETGLPARYAVIRVIASTSVALALLRSHGVVGVVAGAATGGWLEALMLGWQLKNRIGGLGLERVPWGRVAAIATVTVIAPLLARLALGRATEGLVGAATVLGTTAGAFLVAARLAGVLDLRASRGPR